MAGQVVAITGVSGLLGQRLLALLDGEHDVGRVVGLDLREPARRIRRLRFHLVDLANADLVPVLEGVDTVVHLAAVVGPIADDALARRINVEATRRVLSAASGAGVTHIVRAVSAAVYGAWANNPIPLTESDTTRPNPGFTPALHDAECERLLDDWRTAEPGRSTSILRLAPVVGGGADTLFARVAAGKVPVTVRGAAPPVQVVHLDDAESALALAITKRLDGVYNVAADEWLDHEAALAVAPHRRPPALPEEMAERTLSALWMSGLGDAPPGVLPYLVHSWVVSNEAITAEGWSPKHTNEEAILLAGDPEARRRPLPWIAAVAALLLGAAGATWWLRRRHRLTARA